MHELPDRDSLTRLFPVEPDRVDELLTAAATEHVTVAGNGEVPVVAVRGRCLHSKRDPIREARRWARELDLAEATVVVVLGYGSGHHVRAIAERTSARVVVFEPHLEVLRMGLQHGSVPQRTYIITTPEKLGSFLQGTLKGPDRGTIVHWPASLRLQPPLYEAAMAHAKEAVGRAKLHHQTSCLRSPAWLRHYLQNLGWITRGPALPQMHDGLKGTPAIIVAAGPSLDKNVHLLREVEDTAFIFAVNTASAALARAGVKPHALVTIESADITGALGSLPWLDELPAFIELTANPAAWELPFPTKIPISVDTSPVVHFSRRLDPQFPMAAGFCVANAAVVIAERLGCNPIVLVGSDLAYEGERVYASGTIYENMRARSRGDGVVDLEGLDARRDIERRSKEALGHNNTPVVAHTVTVPAWSGHGEVTTTGDFKMIRDWYTHHADKMADSDVSYINATEGGAHIRSWEHTSLAEVIDRHSLAAITPAVTTRRRFAEALTRASFCGDSLRREVDAELGRVRATIELAAAAVETVGQDPDGDLCIDEQQAAKLTEINAKTRSLLAESPLAQAAVYVPVEQIRQRGDLSTHVFYASLIDSLEDLASNLARVLQQMEERPEDEGLPHDRRAS